ncbi:YbjQ family protein [Pararhizobium sp. BT-229]|uniref:YbjQ family protein n=1 Tax=Pararhizobium sp. BT-229 TaxID=2986923 RepID=UPI0021F7D3A1|nr:YbjQ family protein [Pararhizobium sp. BT-229]MCV9965697.1 YbjQ family protein [Pararhizobium sp. BT-229]
MELLCKECSKYKPDSQVKLGICDDCFNYGSPRTEAPNRYQAERASAADLKRKHESVILTTAFEIPNRKIEAVISIVASEAALGMNLFRDIANSWRDVVGGRANSAQASLKEARSSCLAELRKEAFELGADAVIAVDLDYNELSTGGAGGILFVAATGTAVKLAP